MYSKLLQKIVAEANITQDELSNKCKELGCPISRGRINEILNGKAIPPSENVSRAIAKICNADERKLVLQAYLEKAPHELIDFFNRYQELLFELSVSRLENIIKEDTKKILLEEYKNQTILDIIIEVLDMKNNITTDNDYFKVTNEKNDLVINFETPYIIMNDNSMESKIPKNSKLRYIIKDSYKNGDILLVEYNNIKYVRLAIFLGRNIFLYAFNPEYKGLYLKNEEYKIIAKINSIEIKI